MIRPRWYYSAVRPDDMPINVPRHTVACRTRRFIPIAVTARRGGHDGTVPTSPASSAAGDVEAHDITGMP